MLESGLGILLSLSLSRLQALLGYLELIHHLLLLRLRLLPLALMVLHWPLILIQLLGVLQLT